MSYKYEKDLRKVLELFDENGIYAKCNELSIARGGYDLNFQIYFEGKAIIDCVAGELQNDGIDPAEFLDICNIITDEYKYVHKELYTGYLEYYQKVEDDGSDYAKFHNKFIDKIYKLSKTTEIENEYGEGRYWEPEIADQLFTDKDIFLGYFAWSYDEDGYLQAIVDDFAEYTGHDQVVLDSISYAKTHVDMEKDR